jgi:hypothetical protein
MHPSVLVATAAISDGEPAGGERPKGRDGRIGAGRRRSVTAGDRPAVVLQRLDKLLDRQVRSPRLPTVEKRATLATMIQRAESSSAKTPRNGRKSATPSASAIHPSQP